MWKDKHIHCVKASKCSHVEKCIGIFLYSSVPELGYSNKKTNKTEKESQNMSFYQGTKRFLKREEGDPYD